MYRHALKFLLSQKCYTRKQDVKNESHAIKCTNQICLGT